MTVQPSDNQSETTLYLIRHGQAVVNVTRAMGGPRGDIGLTALGRAQAMRLHDRLAKAGFHADRLIASSLPRARETAEIIAPALGIAVELDDDLHELRVGPDADGLSMEDYIQRFGWIDIESDPFTPVDPGGESWARFMLRVSETLHRIVRENFGKTIVIVCHGGIVDGSLIHFFGMNPHSFPPARLQTRNTSLTRWTHSWVKGKRQWQLDFYNDVNHLDGLDASSFAPPVAPIPTEPIH